MQKVYAVVNGVARRISGLRAVLWKSEDDFRKYGRRFYRHKLLRLVTASEVMREFPKLSERLRKELTHALKRSTRAWLTRHPNLKHGEHIRRCRELWAGLESFSPKLIVSA